MPPSPERSRALFPVIIHHEDEAQRDVVQESAASDGQQRPDESHQESATSVDKLRLINAWLTQTSDNSRNTRKLAEILDDVPERRRSPLPQIHIHPDPEAAQQIEESLREPPEPIRSDVCELTQHTGSHFSEQEVEVPDDMERDIDEAVEEEVFAKRSQGDHSEIAKDG